MNYWGVLLESNWTLNSSVIGVTRAPHRRTLALGEDIRGDVVITTTRPGFTTATYNEGLDTRYYDVYAAWGCDYSIPFLSSLSRPW